MKRKFNLKNQKAIRQMLRNRMTYAELTLWYYLRNRFIDRFRFRRQYGVGPYIVDFYCPEARLAIEVDGDSHYQQGADEQDLERQRYIENLGIKVVRVTNFEVKDGIEHVVAIIQRELHSRTPSNSPSKRGRNSKGFSLAEAILSSALFALLATALAGAAIFGRESVVTAAGRARGTMIAEEGLEATRNLRDASFAILTNGTHGLVISGNQWTLSGSSDSTDIFTRSSDIQTPSNNRRQVTSRVTWKQNSYRTGITELTTYLTNWRASVGAPTSCKTFCQSLGTYQNGQCRADTSACTSNGETYESGGDQYCPGTDAVDACCCQL